MFITKIGQQFAERKTAPIGSVNAGSVKAKKMLVNFRQIQKQTSIFGHR
jgi:hypothetical protein